MSWSVQHMIAGNSSARSARPLGSRGGSCPASTCGLRVSCPRKYSTAPSTHVCASLPRGRVAAARVQERVSTEEPALLSEDIDDQRFHQELQKRLNSFGSDQIAQPGQTSVGEAGPRR